MPRGIVQLLVLLLAVPVQYLITKWTLPSKEERINLVKGLGNSFVALKNEWLDVDGWRHWLAKNFHHLHPIFGNDEDECIAVEVMELMEPNRYFAGSPKPRDPRPKHIKFRVGQVIRHKKYGYRGVIVGWDVITHAPDSWIQTTHPPHRPDWILMPNYSILVDVRDRPLVQRTYVVEENIEVLNNVKIDHPLVQDYFDMFDGAQYIPRPAVKALYPND